MDEESYVPSLLAVQSVIVGEFGTYMDYRDYILSIVSNPGLLNCPIRLNIENNKEVIAEFEGALSKNGFRNFVVTGGKPSSWSEWMISQIEATQSDWIMPFPGDHIYLHSSSDEFISAVRMGEKLSADAIAYGHVNDFEYFLDWRRLKVLYKDNDYILFSWGGMWKKFHNRIFQVNTQRTLSKCLAMPEVIGFCIYTRKLINKILRSMPKNNIRWHEMERVHIPDSENYKVLVPRKLLYYHVHSYWIGVFRWCEENAIKLNHKENLKKLESLYLPTGFNWKTTSGELGVKNYRQKVISNFPDINNSLQGNTFEFIDRSGDRPFFLERLVKKFEILRDVFISRCFFGGIFLKDHLNYAELLRKFTKYISGFKKIN